MNVAEVPPHSSCTEMWKVMGFLMEIQTGKILVRLEEAKLRENWSEYLGKRFEENSNLNQEH